MEVVLVMSIQKGSRTKFKIIYYIMKKRTLSFLILFVSLLSLSCLAQKADISKAFQESEHFSKGELIVVFENSVRLKKAKKVANKSGINWKRSVVDQKELRIAILTVPEGKEKVTAQKLVQSKGIKAIYPSTPEIFEKLISKRKIKLTQGSLTLAEKQPGQWTWIPNNNYIARDGSTSGFLVNMQKNSNKFLIYLQGGGACSNPITCISNPNHFDIYNFENFVGAGNSKTGIFNRSNKENVFKDWNIIFLPYVSGDLHGGNNPDADIPGGPQNQVMQGNNNVGVAIEAIKAHFGDNIKDMFLTGSSAGGFGSLLNYDRVAMTFPNLNISMLSDAGPIFINPDIYFGCLEKSSNKLFKPTLPEDLLQMETDRDYNFENQKIYEFLAKKYPKAQFGLYSTYMDKVIRNHYGFGNNNCANVRDHIKGEVFKNGLIELNDLILSKYDNWKVFYNEGETHTILMSKTFSNLEIKETSIEKWVSDLTEKKAINVMK